MFQIKSKNIADKYEICERLKINMKVVKYFVCLDCKREQSKICFIHYSDV